MNCFFTLLISLLLSGTAVLAQTALRVGVRGGANRAQLTIGENSNAYLPQTVDNSALYAWQAGLVVEANFGKFAFQPALLFSQKGWRFNTTQTLVGVAGTDTWEYTGTSHHNWLELPLNVVYTQHGDHGFQLFAGPYAALAVGGHQRGTRVAHSWTGATYTDPLDRAFSYNSVSNGERVDVGLNFGVGYRQGPLQVQLGYGLGLRNLHELTQRTSSEAGSADAAYNRVTQLTGTYFFTL